MKWVLIGLGAVIALLVALVGIGALLPKGHVAVRRARYGHSPETIWAAITDYAGQATWRPELTRVEALPAQGGQAVWRETGRRGSMTLQTTEAIAPKRLVRRIADESLPFGGRWIYEIEAIDGGAMLTITEEGEVYNPIFRVISRFMDPGRTADTYLRALAAKFGEQITVERIEG